MILAILQARMTSTRLPGKVMRPLLGIPMIERQVERIRRSKHLDQLVLATSNDITDDVLAEHSAGIQVACSRGSLNDVLDRFYQTAVPYTPEHVVRLTGDCPLIDPTVIDAVVEMHLAGSFDYTSNRSPPTFPDGLDTEIFTLKSLKCAWQNAQTTYQREHVTPFIYEGGLFRSANFRNDVDLSELRWTVDEEPDFRFVERVFEELYNQRPDFDMHDVVDLLNRQPEISQINGHVGQKPANSAALT